MRGGRDPEQRADRDHRDPSQAVGAETSRSSRRSGRHEQDHDTFHLPSMRAAPPLPEHVGSRKSLQLHVAQLSLPACPPQRAGPGGAGGAGKRAYVSPNAPPKCQDPPVRRGRGAPAAELESQFLLRNHNPEVAVASPVFSSSPEQVALPRRWPPLALD